jgi:hypothetical protein
MDLEDGQVIDRPPPQDLLSGRLDPLASTDGAFLAAKDGFDLLEVQSRTGQVKNRIEDLLHLSVAQKDLTKAVTTPIDNTVKSRNKVKKLRTPDSAKLSAIPGTHIIGQEIVDWKQKQAEKQ